MRGVPHTSSRTDSPRQAAPPDVTAFFAAFSKEVGRAGRPRSARTIALTHRVLSMALAHAVRTGVLARNPAEGARDDLPRGTPAAEKAIWTPEQLGHFLDAMVGDRLYPLWVLAAATGMRRGELCGCAGMTWTSTKRSSRSARARVMVHGVATETGPKTSAGERTLSLDEVTVAVLADRRLRQHSDEIACGAGFWHAQGYVFADEVGRPLIPEYVTKSFTRAARRVGLPPIRLHDARHSYATAMLQAGVDVKVVAGRLGHANTVITQNVYQHRVEQLDRDAAKRVAGLIFGEAQEEPGPR